MRLVARVGLLSLRVEGLIVKTLSFIRVQEIKPDAVVARRYRTSKLRGRPGTERQHSFIGTPSSPAWSRESNAPSPGCIPVMELILYTSAFCAPCVRARSVLRKAGKLLAQASIREVDVLSHLAESEEAGIASTPTLVVRRDGTEVFRASGVPSVQQVLAAAALALA